MTHSTASTGYWYRNDIDGLRAFAVLPIVLFHLQPHWLPGGFVGVDIFFVISGFVIFRLLLRDAAAGTLSFKGFWARRIRRIFPSMLVVIALTLLAGLFVLPPGALIETAESGLAAQFLVANFYFADRIGYFAPIAGSRELIHLWSLSVEEQFYLLVPLLFLLRPSRRGLAACLGIIIAASFVFNVAQIGVRPEKVFYWPMSRFWEIGAGGLVAVVEPWTRGRRWWQWPVFTVGMALLLASFAVLSETRPFPGYAALLPVIGTALVILSCGHDGFKGAQALGFPALRWQGRLSYTLYLTHWPVIVLGDKLWQNPDVVTRIAVYLALMYGFAILIRVFIEQPLRRGSVSRSVKVIVFGFVTTFLLAAVILIVKGMPERLSENGRAIQRAVDASAAGLPCNASIAPRLPRGVHPCTLGAVTSRPDVVIIGDSHAAMITSELTKVLLDQGVESVMSLNLVDYCLPLVGARFTDRPRNPECHVRMEHVFSMLRELKPDTLIIGARWGSVASTVNAPGDGRPPREIVDPLTGKVVTFERALRQTAQAVGEETGIVLIGPFPEQNIDVPQQMLMQDLIGGVITPMSRVRFDVRQAETLEALDALDELERVEVALVHEAFCDVDICTISSDGLPLYKDDDHVNDLGAIRALPIILDAITRTEKKRIND